MEVLILVLLLGLVGLIVFFFKFSSDDVKQQKNIEDAKIQKISDLETEMARKDTEMKKMMEDRQKIEENFFKVKDQVDIFKKENAELMAKIKILEKAKEEYASLKDDIKQKDIMLQQETIACQKLQGENSLKEMQIEKITNELEGLKQELKTKIQMFDGLKGQFEETEAELNKLREDTMKKQGNSKETTFKDKPEPGIVSGENIAPETKVNIVEDNENGELKKGLDPSEDIVEPEQKASLNITDSQKNLSGGDKNAADALVTGVEKSPVNLDQKLKKDEASGILDASAQPEVGKSEEIPGFPRQPELKIDIRQDVPADTDFLKAESVKKPDNGAIDIPEGAFKFTNVNKPPAKPNTEPKDKS